MRLVRCTSNVRFYAAPVIFACFLGFTPHIPHPSGGDSDIFPGAFFARTATPNSGMLSSHERRYTKRWKRRRPWRKVVAMGYRASKSPNIAPAPPSRGGSSTMPPEVQKRVRNVRRNFSKALIRCLVERAKQSNFQISTVLTFARASCQNLKNSGAH